MRILVIDTATQALSVALLEDGQTIGHFHEIVGRGHAEALLPAIAALPGTEPADQAAGNSLPVQDDTELALIERPVSVPHPQPAANTVAPVRAAASVLPSPSADSKADDLAGQPNLVPHRDRVEHFRQLLARQSG